MAIEHWSEDIWLVKLSPEPGLSDDLAAANVQAGRAARTPSLVVDLSGVFVLNSSHLAQLLRLRKLMIEGDSKMRLAGPPDAIWAVFLTTGLDKLFDFTPDVSTALAAMKMEEQ